MMILIFRVIPSIAITFFILSNVSKKGGSVDLLLLSRLQFALTTIFHFLYVPLTMGIVFFVAILETIYYKTKDQKYKKLAQFFGKIFIINFAIGVVTGIVQEFQFGMNWSEYSRFVGDIFGAPLAIEALVAFFLESTFIGVWIWGRNYVSHKMYVVSIWLVVLGSNLSAFWILVANSWMQNPVGFELVGANKVHLNDFIALISNPYVWRQFPHLFFSAHLTAAVVVLGISAYQILYNKSNAEYFKKSFKYAAYWGLVASVLLGAAGHSQAQFLVKKSPMKMAAAEALWETKDPAPFTLFGVFDEEKRENRYVVDIPYVLSLLSYNKPSGAVRGMNDIEKELIEKHGPGDYIPPVNITFYAFKVMIAIGTILPMFLSLLIFYFIRKKDIPNFLMKLSFYSIPLPFIANSAGWILTEVGRYPWVVNGMMQLKDAVTPSLSTTEVVISLVFYAGVYSFGTFLMIFLMSKETKKGIN